MDLEDGIEVLKKELPRILKDYRKGVRHAIWILEEKLDEEERKHLNEEEFEFNRRNEVQ